jgi:hypothetical protein
MTDKLDMPKSAARRRGPCEIAEIDSRTEQSGSVDMLLAQCLVANSPLSILLWQI